MLTRRRCLRLASAAAASLALPAFAAPQSSSEQRLATLERQSGGRLGVALLDTRTGTTSGYRQHERFPMCSTFKFLLAGAVLARVDRHQEYLGRLIRFNRADLLPYAPVTTPHADGAGLSVADLCAAAVTLSDNTAANLLLRAIGGPPTLTLFTRTLGDKVTRLDRTEPTLNDCLPGDPRDTSSPAAIVGSMRALTLGTALSPASRERLTAWLVGCTTGAKRIRAGLPSTWRVGDKTGTGVRGTANDVAIAWPPGHPPLLLATFLTGATALTDDTRSDLLAEATRAALTALPL